MEENRRRKDTVIGEGSLGRKPGCHQLSAGTTSNLNEVIQALDQLLNTSKDRDSKMSLDKLFHCFTFFTKYFPSV